SGRANDGYRFTHPRFRDHFLEADMTATERAQREQRFLAAGRAQLDELASGAVAPEDASRYFLRHLADHLVRARAPAEDILCLASEARLDAWLAIDPGGRGLLRDLEIASRAAAGLDDRAMASGVPARGIGVELLRGLCAASLRSRAHSMTPVLAVEALRRSLITAERAVDLGMQQEDAGARCDILAALLEAGLDDDLRP